MTIRSTNILRPAVVSEQFLEECIRFSREHRFPRSNDFYPLSPPDGVHRNPVPQEQCSRDPNDPDPHALPEVEAQCYYAGVNSQPRLIYRTGRENEKWSMVFGRWTGPPERELRPVFNHPICRLWNYNLGWKVVSILDAHKVCSIVVFQLAGVRSIE